MKYTTEQIRKLSLSADSIADMFAKYHEVLREELDHNNGRKISRSKIEFAVTNSMREACVHKGEYSHDKALKTAEAALAAAGFTIVDDEPEQLQGWQPIATAPLDEWVLIVDSDGKTNIAGIGQGVWLPRDNGIRMNTPTHWMPIPPLPESDK